MGSVGSTPCPVGEVKSFCRKMHKYDCEEVRQLVITCLIELELKLLPKDLAKVIERFVQ